MAEELEILEIGKSIGGVRKSLEDYSKTMDRSMGEYRRDMDRSMGELRSLLVDLCLKSGITEIQGQTLSRKDSHVFVHSRDNLNSARVCAAGKIEERRNDMEVNFKLHESSVSSYSCESSLNSNLKVISEYHQHSIGNSSNMSSHDESEGVGENRKKKLLESKAEYQALKVFDKVSERSTDENGEVKFSKNITELNALELSDKKLERGESQVFDKMSKRSELEVYDQMLEKGSLFGQLCFEENLHIIKIGAHVDEEETVSLQDTPIGEVPFKLEQLGSPSDGSSSLHKWNYHLIGVDFVLGESNEKGIPGRLQPLDAHFKIEELQVLNEMLDQDTADKGMFTTQCGLRMKAKTEDDDERVWLCLIIYKEIQLPLPPPEPPPHQLVAHSNPWSLRTRTILRGWICNDPFLIHCLIENSMFVINKSVSQ